MEENQHNKAELSEENNSLYVNDDQEITTQRFVTSTNSKRIQKFMKLIIDEISISKVTDTEHEERVVRLADRAYNIFLHEPDRKWYDFLTSSNSLNLVLDFLDRILVFFGLNKVQLEDFSISFQLSDLRFISSISLFFIEQGIWKYDTIFPNFVKVPIIRYVLEKLILNECFVIEDLEQIKLEDISQLMTRFLKNKYCLCYQLQLINLFLNVILDKGWLSYKELTRVHTKVKLTNLSFLAEIQKLLKHYFTETYQIDDTNCNEYDLEITKYLNNCVKFFNAISPNCDEDIFIEFIESFNKLVDKLNITNENNYHNLIFDILCKTEFSLSDNRLMFTDGKPEIIFYKKDFVIVVQATYRKNPEEEFRNSVERYKYITCDSFKNLNQRIYLAINNIDEDYAIDMYVLINSTDLWHTKYY